MQSGNPANTETTEARVTRLLKQIEQQLNKLNEKLQSFNPSDECVTTWTHKINVLKAAKGYLWGKVVNLEHVMTENPCYNHSWFLFGGWQPSANSQTALLMDEVKAVPVDSLSKPVSPITNTHTVSLKGPRDTGLLFLASWRHQAIPLFDLQGIPQDVMHYILSQKHVLDELFTQALEHAAYGRLIELQAMLDQYPVLVLLRGTVTTPGGLTVENTTLLECAVGAGDFAPKNHPETDPWMTEMIIPYFDKVPGGADALQGQLERCRAVLFELENQKAYDLTGLMQEIKKASKQDVTDMLNKKMDSKSGLCSALKQFRIDVTPGTITEPHIHYNYQTLIHAFELLDNEWLNLTGDQQDLFWRQVIGYLQRSLPAVDRFIFARAMLYDLVENKIPLERNAGYKYGSGSFPICCRGHSILSGPGFEIAIYGARAARARRRGPRWSLQKLMSNKNFRLCELMPRAANPEMSCVIS